MILKIRRYDPSTQQARYDHYDIRQKPGMTVLSALLMIQERIDDTLAFRYCCQQATCGACGMFINRKPRLACRTQLQAVLDGYAEPVEPLSPATVLPSTEQPCCCPLPAESWDARNEIIIEPLPNFHVLKDLIVDLRKFFRFEQVIGSFAPSAPATERELLLLPAKAQELQRYADCLSCGICYAACPVAAGNPSYLGPSVLSRLYARAIDPRENQERARLLAAEHEHGWSACGLHENCRRVCPQGIPLDKAIRQAQERLKLVVAQPTVEEPLPEAPPAQSPPLPPQLPKPRRRHKGNLRHRLHARHALCGIKGRTSRQPGSAGHRSRRTGPKPLRARLKQYRRTGLRPIH